LPREEDWKAIIKYSERIQRISYDETANNIAPSIFSILEECRPTSYILPRLQELTWRVDTATALERCTIFLHPDLQTINLDIGNKFQKLSDFLTDMSSRTKLKGFSLTSPTYLPDNFTELLARQDALEKIALVAPGALSPGIGRWVASLPHLKHLQLDLSGRSPIAVEGFFDELRPSSGDSTPSSIGSRDSGVFSGEELDFTEIRKSALRLTGDLPSKGSFTTLKKLHLTGEVANIAVFLKHLDNAAITHLELVIEDPPDNADWQDLSELICERLAESLQVLRIAATPSSKFADLIRSTSRAEPPTGRLSLERLVGLTSLVRLDIDLPESVVFTPADIESVAEACPNLEVLRLCPLARFPPPHSPKITLESLSPLMLNCRRLNTLAIVFNATSGSDRTLASQGLSSKSMLRLHVGHSWAHDPLQISILLSHLMPKLELLKWFQEKNRVGFIEGHAKTWQAVSEIVPHLQLLRTTERSFVPVPPPASKPETLEKSVDATVSTSSRGVLTEVRSSDASTQFSPTLVSREVEAKPNHVEVCIDATPQILAVVVRPDPTTTSLSTTVQSSSNGIAHSHGTSIFHKPYANVYWFTSLVSLFSFAYRCAILPVSLTSRILQLALTRLQIKNWQPERDSAKASPASLGSTDTTDSIPLETLVLQ